ncbi:hypothetical protein [Delftia phage PhiW-14]|uniref:Uncharacterized protein n=1 Tax=Delftia phage PhiW-14 TaxID=665032 RepID=C9DFY0_BPW14|nr:hypothetical protein DP-phiW-14_gp008 [Delftia phage PhiW-14]ACV50031.1 hypothetical protein [Delftia phage PhiW-14]
MSSVKSKLDKLNSSNNPTSQINQQLMWPSDLKSPKPDHPGIAMVFELNKTTSAAKEKDKRAYEQLITGMNSMGITKNFYGEDNTEVSMQRDAGNKSMRDPNKASEFGGGTYVKTPYTIILPPAPASYRQPGGQLEHS